MLLLIRLRALLFELCPDHDVAFCGTCSQGYRPEQLGTNIGNAFYCCRRCGADLSESLKTHARTCPSFFAQKPLARIDPATPTWPLARARRLPI